MGNEVIKSNMQLPTNATAILAKQREEMAARLSAPSGDVIRLGGKEFKTPDGEVTRDPIERIVLDFQYLNVLYDGDYVEGSPGRALCYANGPEAKTLAPTNDVPDKQAVSCKVCPQAMWGSAKNGRGGKECKNRAVLALLPVDANADTAIEVMSLPPSSIKHFDKYIRTLTVSAGKNPIEVVTRIGFNPSVTWPEPMFEPSVSLETGQREFVLNPAIELSMSHSADARTRLEAEKPNIEEQVPKSSGRKVMRK